MEGAEGSAKKQQEDEESEDDDDEEEEEFTQDANDERTQVDTFKKILPYLKTQESILRAIKRLGKSNSGTGSAASGSLSASQRWLKKKNQPTESQMDTDSSSTASTATADKEALEKLTGYANYFIDQGFYDIYEETRETLQKKIDNFDNKSSKQTPAASLDIFADEVDEKELQPSTSGEQKGLEGIYLFFC
jgi:hypothetical protein